MIALIPKSPGFIKSKISALLFMEIIFRLTGADKEILFNGIVGYTFGHQVLSGIMKACLAALFGKRDDFLPGLVP